MGNHTISKDRLSRFLEDKQRIALIIGAIKNLIALLEEEEDVSYKDIYDKINNKEVLP